MDLASVKKFFASLTLQKLVPVILIVVIHIHLLKHETALIGKRVVLFHVHHQIHVCFLHIRIGCQKTLQIDWINVIHMSGWDSKCNLIRSVIVSNLHRRIRHPDHIR